MTDTNDNGIIRTIEDSFIDWEYKVHDGEKTQGFEEEPALALMLINEVIFLNSHWWEKEWPEAAQKTVALCVNCNDIFMWGCADAEGLEYKEIEGLYRMWRKDPTWGAAVWCIQKRKLMPQKPVEKRIRAAGIWNLDEMGLKTNGTN